MFSTCDHCRRAAHLKMHLNRLICCRCRASELVESVDEHIGLSFGRAEEIIRISLESDRFKDDTLAFVLCMAVRKANKRRRYV